MDKTKINITMNQSGNGLQIGHVETTKLDQVSVQDRKRMCKEKKRMKVVLDEGAYMPEKAHRADAGYDLRTPERVVLRRHESVTIDTGVHMAIPDGWYGKLESKSGLNVKHSIVSLGGVIDSSYTGSIVAKLYNLGDEDYVFEKGDKIIQIVFMQCGNFSMTQVDELEETARGANGFGSTGK